MTRRLFVTALSAATLSALLLAAPPLSALAAPAGWTVPAQVTSATASGFDEVSVSSSLVAMRWTGFPVRIWTWTPGQTAAGQLPLSAYSDSLAVSGNRAVWRQDGGALEAIMTWRVGGLLPAAFATGAQDYDFPALWGDRVAWLVIGTGDQRVLTRKISQTATTTVSAIDSGPKIDVAVSGDRVVWNGWDGHTWQIYTRVAGEAVVTTITADLAPHISPQVSGDRVVWMSQDAEGDGIVCTWKKGDAQPTTLGHAPYEGHPKVSGDFVVWTAGTPGDTQVYLWRPGHVQPEPVTAGPHSASSAGISGDRMVWQDQVGGQYQIVTRRIGESLLTTIAISADALADPVVGDNRVAWGAFDGTAYQVFTAAGPAVATGVTRPTVSPLTPTHGHTATFKSYLVPGVASFASRAKATLRLYHYESRHWRLRSTVTMKRASSGLRALLSASVKPRYAGSWRAVVRFEGAVGYSGKASVTRSFRVR